MSVIEQACHEIPPGINQACLETDAGRTYAPKEPMSSVSSSPWQALSFLSSKYSLGLARKGMIDYASPRLSQPSPTWLLKSVIGLSNY